VILTDREIKLSIAAGQIEIEPPPADDCYASTTVDLTLDSVLRIFRPDVAGAKTIIDPSTPNFDVKILIASLADQKLIDPEDGFPLGVDKFVLGWTREKINLKLNSRVAGRVEGKSSLARLGLAIHVTAPTIHAGFRGPIQLEIKNHGSLPILLKTGMKICQMVFEQTTGMPDKAYQGQFLGQQAN
jgi:dCTP deaminase